MFIGWLVSNKRYVGLIRLQLSSPPFVTLLQCRAIFRLKINLACQLNLAQITSVILDTTVITTLSVSERSSAMEKLKMLVKNCTAIKAIDNSSDHVRLDESTLELV